MLKLKGLLSVIILQKLLVRSQNHLTFYMLKLKGLLSVHPAKVACQVSEKSGSRIRCENDWVLQGEEP